MRSLPQSPQGGQRHDFGGIDMLAPALDATDAAWARSEETLGPLTMAQALRGYKVLNRADENLGEVVELLLDVPRGRIAYALMSCGGVLGSHHGERMFPLPWTALTLDKHRNCLVMDASKRAFDSAPALAKDRWSEAAPIDWHENVHRFYGARPYWD
jgi:hypothetical protein